MANLSIHDLAHHPDSSKTPLAPEQLSLIKGAINRANLARQIARRVGQGRPQHCGVSGWTGDGRLPRVDEYGFPINQF